MCKLDGTTCNECLEITVKTDSGMILNFTYDPTEVDNSILTTWLMATDFVDSYEIRNVGDTVWTTISKEQWHNG